MCAIISFRLGMTDGVSVVAAAWQEALEALGWSTYTVAGDGPVDHLVPGLALDAKPIDTEDLSHQLGSVLADADVVLVENMLSIPINLVASRALISVLRGRPAVLHHHDPPWQRTRFAHVTELPPDDPAWRHITINRLTEAEFAERGVSASTIYNGFNVDLPPGDGTLARQRLGIDESALLAAHPVRAIARKNIPAALSIATQIGATYWLPGPAEEGYEAELQGLLQQATCPVLRDSVVDLGLTMSDLYAASTMIVFPSTWEGFGNPPIEAAVHRRPVVVGSYPVSNELQELGFSWYRLDEIERLQQALSDPGAASLGPGGTQSLEESMTRNYQTVAQKLSINRMTDQISDLFDQWVIRP